MDFNVANGLAVLDVALLSAFNLHVGYPCCQLSAASRIR